MAKPTALAALFAVVLAGGAAAEAPVAVDPKTFDSDLGWYQLETKAVLHVWSENGRYYVRFGRRPAAEVFPSGPDTLANQAGPVELTFQHDPLGAVTAVTVGQYGGQRRGARITEAAAAAVAAAEA